MAETAWALAGQSLLIILGRGKKDLIFFFSRRCRDSSSAFILLFWTFLSAVAWTALFVSLLGFKIFFFLLHPFLATMEF